MALRIANKINRQFLQNVIRTLSAKREVPELELTTRSDATKNQEAAPPPQGAVQYQVCQPRAKTLSSLHGRGNAHNEADVAKNHMAMQHLQPALLPEYFKPPVEINSCMYPDAITETEKQSSIKKARRFEDSMTRMNLTLPLKAPKLANPFPEPVKVMESCTVSDQEKAELMLAERRMANRAAQSSSEPQQAPRGHGLKNLQHNQRRYYSTEKKNGKKGCKIKNTMDVDPKKEKCKEFKVPYCADSSHNYTCSRFTGYPICKKKLSPYASYSEMCPDEPYRKPSECKMCPWKPDEHPSFKPPKKKFHTNTPTSFLSKKKEECCDVIHVHKEPCAWVKLDKEKEEKAKNKGPPSTTKPKRKAASILYPTMTKLVGISRRRYMTKKNKPCPGVNPCNENKRSKEVKPPPKKGKTPAKQKSCGVSLGHEIGAWLQQVTHKKTSLQEAAEASKVLQQESLRPKRPYKGMSLKTTDRCTKFPFKQMSFPLVKQRPIRPKKKPGTCPKKPMPKMIKDCPPIPEKDDRACDGLSVHTINDPVASVLDGGRFGYLMNSGSTSGNKKKDDKCPKINLGICSTLPDKMEPDVDQCGRGPKPKSWKCPTDLVKTHTPGYRKPRKKSCPVLPHISSVTPSSEHRPNYSR